MSYLIDSDIVIDYLFDVDATTDLILAIRRNGLAISTLTHMEVTEGVMGGATPTRASQGFKRFLRGTRVLVVNRPIAERTAQLRLNLRRQGHPVNHRTIDLIIAATAIEHRLILVTRNFHDYADIPGLLLHDR